MKQTVHQKDVEMGMGMLLAYDAMKSSGRTALATLGIILHGEGPDENYIWDMCEQRAEGLIEAVEEVESMLDLSTSTKREKMMAIKESAVMTAVCEMILVTEGEGGFEKLDLEELRNGAMEAVIKTLTGGYDPGMIRMVAAHVAEGSFPRENPTKEILATLWVEGYVTTLLGPLMYEDLKDTDFAKKFFANVHKNFIVLD